MFLPIRDDNPHTITPVVNYAFIGINAAIFLWQLSLGDNGEQAVMVYGFIPADLFGGRIDPSLGRPAAWLTIFSSMFMHGGWMHLLGNMLYLWIFGDNIEASLGHGRYAVFYLLCGVVAALSQGIAAPNSAVPMIGASGAVSGVLGAYLVLHPRANIKVFVWLLLYITTWNLPAFIVLGFWFGGQLLSSAAANAAEPGVAFMAHIGGFVVGAVLVMFMKRRGVRLFAPAYTRPFAVEKHAVRYRRRGSVPEAGVDPRRGPWG